MDDSSKISNPKDQTSSLGLKNAKNLNLKESDNEITIFCGNTAVRFNKHHLNDGQTVYRPSVLTQVSDKQWTAVFDGQTPLITGNQFDLEHTHGHSQIFAASCGETSSKIITGFSGRDEFDRGEGKMRCQNIQRLIIAQSDAALTVNQKRRIEDHLVDCPQCKQFAEDLILLQHSIKEQPVPILSEKVESQTLIQCHNLLQRDTKRAIAHTSVLIIPKWLWIALGMYLAIAIFWLSTNELV